MKKLVILITGLSVLFHLTACGSEPIASDKALVNGNNAVEVAEKYIAGERSGNSACDALDEIYEALSYVADYTSEEKLADQQKFADYMIHLDIFLLNSEILTDSGMFGNAETFQKVEERLQNLKDTINKYD